jgi:hypothetical protein
VVSALAVVAASGPAVAADTGSDAAATSFTVNHLRHLIPPPPHPRLRWP